MANTITIKVGLDTGDIRQGAQQIERQVKEAVDGAVRQAETGGRKIGSALSAGIASSLKGAGTALTVGLSLPLTALGAVAIKAAKDLDVTRQQLVALTGSTEAANKKLAELRKLAQESPGVTSRFAQQAFAQLKAVGTIADETINRVIKSVGRLNAVFTIGDVDGFLRNLVQIFNQGFERADIKEALGRVPIFEQLLEQAFGTKDPDKLRQMKEAGKLTINQWLSGLSEGIDSDRRFATVEDNIASRFEKIRERSLEALAPLGEAIIRDVLPVIERLIPKIIELLDAFARLPPGVQENIVKFGLFAIAIGPVARGLGGLIGLVGTLAGKFVGAGGLSAAITAATVKLATFIGIAGPLGLLPIAGIAGFGAAQFDLNERLAASDPATRLNAIDAQREAIRRNRFGGPAIQLPRINADGTVVIDGGFSNLPQDAIDRIQSTGAFRGGSGGGGGETTKAARDKALRERKEFNEAIQSLELERLRQAEEIAKKNREIALDTLEDQYARSLISTEQFYAQKLAIQERNVQAELNLLQVEATQLEAARDVAKGAEKIKIEEQLVKLYAEQQVKVLGLTALLNRNFEEYKKVIGNLDPTLNLSTQEQVQGEFITDAQRRARAALEAAAQAKQDFQREDLRLAIEEQRIQNAINAGVLTEAEGRQALLAAQRASRDELIAYLEIQKNVATGFEADRIQLQIEQLRSLGLELNSTQRFLRGLGSETETLGDIWERFGQNVSRAFGNIRDLFNGLKSAVKQFFADILGNSLRNLLRGTLGALFGGGGAGGGSQSGGFGGGGGGLIGGVIQQTLGGVFGGSLFGTSGTTSTAGGGGGLNFFGGGSSPITGGLNSFLTGGFAGGGGAADILRQGANTAGGGFGAPAGGLLNRLFGNLLGVNPSGGFLASATPILAGIGLGAGIGGQSLLGQILGGIGGGAVGLGLSFGASVFGAGGGLGAAALAALGPAALIGAPLLIGAFLLGRAKQRRKDEEQSGVWLTDAIAGIQQIKSGVQTGSIPPDQARSLFENQVLATFIQQINTLKTKSVRESRLTNQVRDLRNLFDKEVGPAIDAAKKAGVVNRNIIPEFHTGGIAADETLALLKKREMVLTESQQGKINAMLPGVFQAVGVPDAPNTSGVYHSGGRVGPGGFAAENMTVNVTVVMGTQDQTQAFVTGLGSDTGKRALARTIRAGRRDGEI